MKIVFNSPINSINKTTTSKKYSTTTIHNHSASEISNNVAFCGGQNLGVVTTRIKSNKAKMLNIFKEILASKPVYMTEFEKEMYRQKRALNIIKYKNKKFMELSAIAEYIVTQKPHGGNGVDKQWLESVARELKELDKIPLYDEPKKNTKYNPEDYDFTLINLFQKALLNDNFDLKSVYKEYYGNLENIETIAELSSKYPAIKLPQDPIFNIAHRILNIIPIELHRQHQAALQFSDEHQAIKNDIAIKFTRYIMDLISTLGIDDKPELVLAIGKIVIEEFKEMHSEVSPNPKRKFYTVNTNKKTELITPLERRLLDVNYDKFILTVIKNHYLNDVKLNDIVYEENGKTLKVSDLKDTDYKFEKKSEKLKKFVTDSEKIKLMQRDYPKYTQEELKSRLEFYSNSPLGSNEELFDLICEFHTCRFVAEDRGYLIKLLTTLDKVLDKQLTLDDAVNYLKENNIKPIGTHKVNSAEKQKIKEKLRTEHLLNQTLQGAQEEYLETINNLYANNLSQVVEICSKYYPEKADYSVIISSLIFIGLIKELLKNNDVETAQNKILRLEAYKEYSENDADSIIYKDALVYVKNLSYGEKQGVPSETIKTYVKSFTPENLDLSLYHEAFAQLEDFSYKEKVGQYILNRNVVEGYPDSKELVPYTQMFEKIMQNFSKDKNLATILLCKYHDYYALNEKDKSFINNILKTFDSKNADERIILKEIIENDFINSDTSILVNEGNVPKARTISSAAKQELYDKYRFPNSLLYFEKFEDALSLNARSENSSGVKKIDRNNKKAIFKAEVKITGHDDRLVADNNDYYFNHFLPDGVH